MEKQSRVNLLVGLILSTIVTLPTLSIVLEDIGRPSFSPENAWAWLALCCILAFGMVISLIGLMHRIHWGHIAWSQTVLSFLGLLIYIGWYRRELDYVKMGPDPDAIDQGPPIATWQGFLFFVSLWLAVGFFPLALMRLKGWRKARMPPSDQGNGDSSGVESILPATIVSQLPSQDSSLESPPIPKRYPPIRLELGLKLYGLVAYILVAWVLGLRFSAIETILESGAGYVLAVSWIRWFGSRSTRPHSSVIVTGFLLLHAGLTCIIDMRLVAWLIWSFLKLRQMMPRWPPITPQLIAKFADLTIMITAGVVVLLMGRRVIGPRPGINEKYDAFHGKWGKRFRWLGPFIIFFTLFRLGASIVADNMSWTMFQQKGQQDLQASLASNGKLTSRDTLVTAQEGFMIMVPAGYTYTKQPSKAIALFAIAGSNGIDNQVIGVSVSPTDGSLEHGIENVKSVLAGKNPTYRFSEMQAMEARISKYYRINITLQRDGVNMKGGMVFFEKEGKVYSLTYSAREPAFDANADTFERVVRSFAPTISSQPGMKKPSMACANEVRAASPILLRAGMYSPEETHGGMRTQALFELVIGPSGQILQVNIAQPSDNQLLDERMQQELARAPVTLPACAQDGSYWLTTTF